MAEQVCGVVAQHFVQMRCHGCAGVHHGVTQGARHVALCGVNPHSFQTERGLFGGFTFQGAIHLTRIDGQLFAHFDLTLAAHYALEHDVISIGIDGQGIANANGLNQESQLGRQFFAHTFDAVHQLTAGVGVDQWNQAIANFKANQIDLIDIVPIQFFGLFQGGLRCLLCGCGFWYGRLVGNAPSQAGRGQCQGDEHQMRHARHKAQNSQDASRHIQSSRVG